MARVSRNAAWNLVGQGLPLAVGLVAVPPLVHGLGTDRFGVLSLAWILVGYFGLLDLGLGRALTQVIAGRADHTDVPTVVWSSTLLMGLLGLAGGIVLALLSQTLARSVLHIPPELQSETATTFVLLAAALPVVTSTSALRGVLEGYQRFGLINAVRAPMGVLTFLAPLMVLPFSTRLPAVVGSLVGVRVIALPVHFWLCRHVDPELRQGSAFRWKPLKPLLRYGSWITVSNLISPVLVYLDRFVIGSIVSISAVAYYVTPYEVVTKLSLVPNAVVGALFPALAATHQKNQARAAALFQRGVKAVFVVVFPIALAIVIAGQEGLRVWVGPEFAERGGRVAQLLAAGVFISSLAYVPFTLIQSAGRPDLTARFHLIELPIYLGVLTWLTVTYGIVGAAAAWVIRVSLDAALLFGVVPRLLSIPARARARLLWGVLAACAAFVAGANLRGVAVQLMAVAVELTVFAVLVWRWLLSEDERRLFMLRSSAGAPAATPADVSAGEGAK